MITHLLPHQVFVFGSNEDGFHGAGAAGFAFRGQSRNNWRHDEIMLKAIKAPKGSPDRIGRWAVYGEARGLQIGKEGKSYAIVTIVKPGYRCSYPKERIREEIKDLFIFARDKRQDLEFLYTEIGSGLAGWESYEMYELLSQASAEIKIPKNIIFPETIYGETIPKNWFI